MEDERDAEDKESDGPEAATISGTNLSLDAPDSQTILSHEIRSDKQKHVPDLQSANSIILVEQNGQALQFDRVVILAGQDGQLYSVPSFPLGGAQVLLPHGQLVDVAKSSCAFVEESIKSIKDKEDVASCVVTAASAAAQSSTNEKTPAKRPSPACEPPPAGPKWSLRLRGCEKIGDSYRGYCNTEAELEAVLLLHKQQTNAVFGTRQSPCSAKTASRLMWKSQYVPYDGIPFVNAGSRAIVMECQFGPRRKGFQPKKGLELETRQNVHYRATCPARIYIKKVQKFPEYKVPTDPTVDKKVVRQEQEKAFFNLKKSLWDVGGVIRYYVQLPTEKAHLYHDLDTLELPPLPEQISSADDLQTAEEELDTGDLQDVLTEDVTSPSSRLHPRVAEKISELVSLGHNQVYAVRKQLRHYVEREMFPSDGVPDRHNLCYFPTVNDIKNHIHEAQKAFHLTEAPATSSQSEWRTDQDLLLPDTVTPASVDAGSALKDGVLEENSAPEAVQLFTSLSSLQPKTFAHLQAVQLPASMCGVEGSSQHALTNTEPSTFLVSGQCPAPCGTAALLGMTSERSISEGSDTPACATQIPLQAEQALLIETEDPATEV